MRRRLRLLFAGVGIPQREGAAGIAGGKVRRGRREGRGTDAWNAADAVDLHPTF